ncbi:MAG: protein-L-isoaspartate O-methyltransferase [Rhodospirillaceae bacterium]|nr:protein-L-isoaspartate O-methyltransferase [Rhodospirillaceae bacterium]
MTSTRGDDAQMAGARWDRCQALIGNQDLWRDKEIEAFLLTPREIFALERNRARAYEHAFLDIGWGVTISGPHIVGRMTSALDCVPEDRVLEIGTGSGYQSAILSYLSAHPYSIEIIQPLSERTTATYGELAGGKFPEYGNIRTKAADGYFGWEEHAPFQKIIVTAAIDHIPPPLLQQLDVGGTMVIPVGPPGAQTLLKVGKVQEPDGTISITREDLYQGRRKVSFVPFTNAEGGTWSQ